MQLELSLSLISRLYSHGHDDVWVLRDGVLQRGALPLHFLRAVVPAELSGPRGWIDD